MIIIIILTLGTIPFSFTPWITLGFSIRVMRSKIKLIFQTGFKNGGYFLVSSKTFSVLKFLKNIITLLSMEVIWFRLPVQKYYSFFQDSKFLGFFVGTSSSRKWFLFHFPRIWQGNLKLNGGRISPIQLLSKFLISISGYLLKIPLQNLFLQRFLFQFLLMSFFFREPLFLSEKEFKWHLKLLQKKA